MALLAVAFGAWKFLIPSGPELLLERERRSVGGLIKNGVLYSHTFKNDGIAIQAYDLTKKETKTVAETALAGRDIYSVAFNDWCAYFTVSPRPTAIGVGGGGPVSSPRGKPVRDLGRFLLAENRPLRPGEIRTTFRTKPPAVQAGEMHVITLPEGDHRIVAADTRGQAIDRLSRVLTRRELYWVDSPDRASVSVYTPEGRWIEYPESGVLMASPIDGGPPRKIATAVSGIQGNDSAIWWERLRPFPDPLTDLHYYIPRTGESGKITGFGSNSYEQITYLVCHRNRIYWLSPPGRDGSSALYRAALGKTRPEIVLGFPAGSWIDPWAFHSNGRELWVVRGSGNRFGAPESALPDVAVIDSERGRIIASSGPIEGPNASIRAVEQDFVYYGTRESRRHMLDFLSHEDTIREVYGLYRVRLNSVK